MGHPALIGSPEGVELGIDGVDARHLATPLGRGRDRRHGTVSVVARRIARRFAPERRANHGVVGFALTSIEMLRPSLGSGEDPRAMQVKKFYLAATGQNRGKTTLSLGLTQALRARGLRVGFIKPVGQRVAQVDGGLVDEDVVLLGRFLDGADRLVDMSPVHIPRGFTQQYIRGEAGTVEEHLSLIRSAFDRVSADKDVVVVEGTGHAGVGGVVDLSNAAVASALGLEALIVSGGGIGRPIDEILLNRALFRQEGVSVLGAVVNKIEFDRYEDASRVVTQGLNRLGIDVFGVIPFLPLLSYMTMEHIVGSLPGELIAEGRLDLLISNVQVVAMGARRALDFFKERTMVITPGDRDDILLAVLSAISIDPSKKLITGLIVTAGIEPPPSIMRLLRERQIPTYLVHQDTYDTASAVHDLLVKIRPSDTTKVCEVVRLVGEYVDVDRLLDRI
ncbi:MAG: AAA family ATPase [Polyangiaceae bacterium]|nr:AAA family ATPase [Polyangiaceae bacterium]